MSGQAGYKRQFGGMDAFWLRYRGYATLRDRNYDISDHVAVGFIIPDYRADHHLCVRRHIPLF